MNRLQRICIVLFFWVALFFLEQPPSGATTLGGRVHEKTLANGMKALLVENHKAPLVVFQVWYRVGSRNEQWGRTGLSHLLEHMMFKGTERIGPEEFSRVIQENGGTSNAFTTKDYTVYFETLSSDRIEVALALEADRMEHLVFNPKAFETERMVVMEERRLRTEDNPRSCLLEQVEATAFQTHPYHWPVIGWMEDIGGLSLDDVKAHYSDYYHPANAFLVAVGDFNTAELARRIESLFGSIRPRKVPLQERAREPEQQGERKVSLKREAELPFLVVGYRVPNLGSSQDGYVLDVLASLLAGGKSSRLYRSLVQERRLLLDVDVDYSLTSRDPGLFIVSADLLPDASVDEVQEMLDREIEVLKREPVDPEELQRAQRQLEASFVFGQDSFFFQGMLLGEFEIAMGWRYVDEYVPSIQKVTPADIVRVVGRYLIPEKRTIGVLSPLQRRSSGTAEYKGMTRSRDGVGWR